MTWASLKLWADDEEKRIHRCMQESLHRLIRSQCVTSQHDEKFISGKLRPFLYRVRKEMRLSWILQPEASSFGEMSDPDPSGHPDIRFSSNTPDFEQYDYDVECKLVRIKRGGKGWDYCKHYVSDGIQRFQERKYAQSLPPMGAMIGYIQEGNFAHLLTTVNKEVKTHGLNVIRLRGPIAGKGVFRLDQSIERNDNRFTLYHLWADLR